jgi:hypothetical protein
MTKQFLYVLAGAGDGTYADLTYASIAFLRHLHPKDQIILLADAPAANALREAAHPLLTDVSELRVCDTGQSNPVVASRWLKTSMRRLVKGPFVFLDADTLPVGQLDKLFKDDCDFAAVSDYHSADPRRAFPDNLLPLHQNVGWPRPSRYFNSGVLYFGDTSTAHELGDAWHAAWWDWSSANGHHDQPALAYALDKVSSRVKVLPQKWNAMFMERESSVWQARILHAFSSIHGVSGCTESTVFGEVQRLIATKKLNSEAIEEILERNYFWQNEDSVKRQVYCGRWKDAIALLVRRLCKIFTSHNAVRSQG